MINLRLERIYKGVSYTIGKLYLNGKYFCDTLEDTDRGLKDTMPTEEIEKIKVYGKTAIPTGTYKVDMNTVLSLRIGLGLSHIVVNYLDY